MSSARERLGGAQAALGAGYASTAVSGAYYAMLYAARAALSEAERHAKTHRGTWRLFEETFVATERLDRDLFVEVRQIQPVREEADYDARSVSLEEAGAVVGVAERFVAAVADLLGD